MCTLPLSIEESEITAHHESMSRTLIRDHSSKADSPSFDVRGCPVVRRPDIPPLPRWERVGVRVKRKRCDVFELRFS